MTSTPRPIVLVVFDGWGEAARPEGNAIRTARTPIYQALRETYPSSLLTTCGEAVGLPAGQMGNSEVGHMNLGAGRVVFQDLTRIDQAIADGALDTNVALSATLEPPYVDPLFLAAIREPASLEPLFLDAFLEASYLEPFFLDAFLEPSYLEQLIQHAIMQKSNIQRIIKYTLLETS